MQIRSSLKKKSMVALGLYLATFIAIIGSVTYFVVESPVRAKLQQNLDLRAEILSSLIEAPLNSSEGFLRSLVGLAQAQPDPNLLAQHFKSILAASDDTIISAGIWPESYIYNPEREQDSYFFNKADDGKLIRSSRTTTPNPYSIIKRLGIRQLSINRWERCRGVMFT